MEEGFQLDITILQRLNIAIILGENLKLLY